MSEETFAQQIEKLEFIGMHPRATVVEVEPVDAKYWRDESHKQKCIVEVDGKRYWSWYD